MSTRALIGRKNADNTVDYTSINFDGYLAHVGMLLASSWNTSEKLDELFAEGKISSLGPVLGERHDGSKFPVDAGNENFTIFYHRDRNQPLDDTRAQKAATVEEFLTVDSNIGYRYLFDDGVWSVQRKDHNGEKPLMLLADAFNQTSATVEILSKSEDGYILNVDMEENPTDYKDEKAPNLGEVIDFLNHNADGQWEYLIDKPSDIRINVKSDAAVVALKLRFNIGDHAERVAEDATA